MSVFDRKEDSEKCYQTDTDCQEEVATSRIKTRVSRDQAQCWGAGQVRSIALSGVERALRNQNSEESARQQARRGGGGEKINKVYFRSRLC